MSQDPDQRFDPDLHPSQRLYPDPLLRKTLLLTIFIIYNVRTQAVFGVGGVKEEFILRKEEQPSTSLQPSTAVRKELFQVRVLVMLFGGFLTNGYSETNFDKRS